jgi:hypothetical protein
VIGVVGAGSSPTAADLGPRRRHRCRVKSCGSGDLRC